MSHTSTRIPGVNDADLDLAAITAEPYHRRRPMHPLVLLVLSVWPFAAVAAIALLR